MTHGSSGASHRHSALAALAAFTLAVSAPAAFAQLGPESYKATATLKGAAGASETAPVVISIDRWTTDDERAKAVMNFRAGGTPAIQNLLASLADAGSLQVGRIRTPIRFARALPVAGGKVVTVLTAQPVSLAGAGVAGAGHNLAVVTFQVDAGGNGEAGDLAPAAKVKLDDKGAFVVESGAETVRLTGITKAVKAVPTAPKAVPTNK